MQYIDAPVHTLCVGHASSMAAILLAAGAPGQRRAAAARAATGGAPGGGGEGARGGGDFGGELDCGAKRDASARAGRRATRGANESMMTRRASRCRQVATGPRAR